jgi:hypothetical protein
VSDAGTYRADIRNDAAARFEALDLAEKIVHEITGDSLVLDGAEWWVEEGLDSNVFTMTDDETRERYTVTLHPSIERLPAAGVAAVKRRAEQAVVRKCGWCPADGVRRFTVTPNDVAQPVREAFSCRDHARDAMQWANS